MLILPAPESQRQAEEFEAPLIYIVASHQRCIVRKRKEMGGRGVVVVRKLKYKGCRCYLLQEITSRTETGSVTAELCKPQVKPSKLKLLGAGDFHSQDHSGK